MKFKKYVVLCGFSLIGLIACSSSSDNGLPDTISYTGPGSFYDMSMNNVDNTFTLVVKDSFSDPTLFTITGSFVRHATGFLTLSVGEVTPADAMDAPTAGDSAQAFEIPGYAFILKPVGDDSKIIPMLVSGACPTEDFTANWVIAQNDDSKDASDAMQDWFGTFQYTHTTTTGEVTKKFSLAAPTVDLGSPNTLTTSSCSGGFLQLDEMGNDINMWLTANGGAMVNTSSTGGDNSTILALPAQAVELADLAGVYSGLVVDNSSDNDENVSPVKLTMNADGTGSGALMTDIVNDSVEPSGADISLVASPGNGDGWFTGTIAFGMATGTLACTANTDVASTGKSALFCIAQSPDDPTKSFIMTLVSR